MSIFGIDHAYYEQKRADELDLLDLKLKANTNVNVKIDYLETCMKMRMPWGEFVVGLTAAVRDLNTDITSLRTTVNSQAAQYIELYNDYIKLKSEKTQ